MKWFYLYNYNNRMEQIEKKVIISIAICSQQNGWTWVAIIVDVCFFFFFVEGKICVRFIRCETKQINIEQFFNFFVFVFNE